MNQYKNKNNGTAALVVGIILIVFFAVWTVLIKTVDVQAVGVKGSDVGFATLNMKFHNITGANMNLYELTDKLELVAIGVCLVFAFIGLIQWIKRKNMWKVDLDILILGAYYLLVIAGFVIFEFVKINYRPVLIEGKMEASYPSSTTLLVVSVMLALSYHLYRKVTFDALRVSLIILALMFAVFITVARICSGVHWLTDIIGGVTLSLGLFSIYKFFILRFCAGMRR